MKIIALILMAVSAIALILAGLMGLNIIKTDLLNVSGVGFLQLSMACSLLAIAIHVVKPFEKGETGA